MRSCFQLAIAFYTPEARAKFERVLQSAGQVPPQTPRVDDIFLYMHELVTLSI
jgi:hypothetical protein